MNQDRRTFLHSLAAACATGIGQKFKIGSTLVASGVAGTVTSTSASTAAAAAALPLHGTGVRTQVLEVIVRQAITGAPWKEICVGPMLVNGITIEEVERELERRKLIAHDDNKEGACLCLKCVQQRQRELQEKVAQIEAETNVIPHSEKSPCGCNECYRKIISLRYGGRSKKQNEL